MVRSSRSCARYQRRRAITAVTSRTLTALDHLHTSFIEQRPPAPSPVHPIAHASAAPSSPPRTPMSALQSRMIEHVTHCAQRFANRASLKPAEACGGTSDDDRDAFGWRSIAPSYLDDDDMDSQQYGGADPMIDSAAPRWVPSAYLTTHSAVKLVSDRVALPERAGEVNLLDFLPPDIAAYYASPHAGCMRTAEQLIAQREGGRVDAGTLAAVTAELTQHHHLSTSVEVASDIEVTIAPSFAAAHLAADGGDAKRSSPFTPAHDTLNTYHRTTHQSLTATRSSAVESGDGDDKDDDGTIGKDTNGKRSSRALPSRARAYADHDEYIKLLRRMDACGMLTWTTTPVVVVGLFGVAKTDGDTRLILDGRAANEIFTPPPHVALPTPDVFTSLEAKAGERVFVAKTDLSDFFYRFRTPEWMHPWFALPPVTAAECGHARFANAQRVWPCLAVLAMGWSHSVFATQAAHEHIMSTYMTHFPLTHRITSARAAAAANGCVDTRRIGWRPLHGVYIDDMFQFGTDEAALLASQDEYIAVMASLNLPVKRSKVTRPSPLGVEVLGMDIHGDHHTVGVHPSKLILLITETRALIAQRFLTGRQLAAVIGKWTWAALARRPAFAIMSACYRYIRVVDTIPGFTIWPSVIRELHALIALAPLLHSSLSHHHFAHAIAVDASMDGLGVCASTPDASQLAAMRSLPSRPPVTPEAPAIDGGAPHATLTASVGALGVRWRTIMAQPWRIDRGEEHINSYELRAVDAAARWALSHPHAIASRVTVLSDSSVTIGALSKGRSSSPVLLRRCRSIAASLLATGVQLDLRWIPSASNPADGPSRKFSDTPSAPFTAITPRATAAAIREAFTRGNESARGGGQSSPTTSSTRC